MTSPMHDPEFRGILDALASAPMPRPKRCPCHTCTQSVRSPVYGERLPYGGYASTALPGEEPRERRRDVRAALRRELVAKVEGARDELRARLVAAMNAWYRDDRGRRAVDVLADEAVALVVERLNTP